MYFDHTLYALALNLVQNYARQGATVSRCEDRARLRARMLSKMTEYTEAAREEMTEYGRQDPLGNREQD